MHIDDGEVQLQCMIEHYSLHGENHGAQNTDFSDCKGWNYS